MTQPSWNDADRWAALVDGTACPLCSPPHGIVAALPSSHVTMNEQVAVRGYCCLILRHHATELHALDESIAAQLMTDIQTVSRAVQNVTGAVKINYEIHGNIVPHVHVHIIPRYRSDAIERTGLGFAALPGTAYEAGEFDDIRRRIANELGASAERAEP